MWGGLAWQCTLTHDTAKGEADPPHTISSTSGVFAVVAYEAERPTSPSAPTDSRAPFVQSGAWHGLYAAGRRARLDNLPCARRGGGWQEEAPRPPAEREQEQHKKATRPNAENDRFRFMCIFILWDGTARAKAKATCNMQREPINYHFLVRLCFFSDSVVGRSIHTKNGVPIAYCMYFFKTTHAPMQKGPRIPQSNPVRSFLQSSLANQSIAQSMSTHPVGHSRTYQGSRGKNSVWKESLRSL